MRRVLYEIGFFVFLLVIAIPEVSFARSPEVKPLSDSLNQAIKIKDNRAKEVELDLNRDYWKGYISDTKNIITSPSRWGNTEWIKASLIAGITLGLYVYDQEIQDWVQKNRSSTSDEIAKFAKPFGDGRYTLAPLGVLYLYGHFFKNKKAKRLALLSLESFVVTGVFTQAIKFTGHRHRPSSGDPHTTWDGPGFSTSHLSFPSGHTSSAFAIATVIASEFEDKVFIPPLAYGIATLTALSRINDNDHWTSDVFFGSAIGYFTGKAIVGLHSRKKESSLSVVPFLNEKYSGVLVSFKF